MDYIVLDLEWNQSEKGNKDFPFEIVEIGAVKLDSNKNIIGSYRQLIKPQVYRKIHPITKRIIQLDMEELEKGKYFPDAAKDFLEWCGENYLFCTWGSLDLTEFQRNMQYYHMESLSGGPILYYDIQKFFSLLYEDGKVRRSLEYAVEYLNLNKEHPFHMAFYDAYYASLVWKEMGDSNVEENFSFDVFMPPKNKVEEIHVSFSNYSKYISRVFDSKTTAMGEREVTSTRCPICGKNGTKRVRWFTTNRKHYYSISYCFRPGYMKGKIRIKKTKEGGVYIIKTLKLISKEDVVEIKEKRMKCKRQGRTKRHKD